MIRPRYRHLHRPGAVGVLSRLIGSALASLALMNASAADDIYRTVDAQGHVTYSDHAVSAASRKMTVDVIPADPENAARLAKQRAVDNASDADQEKAAKQDAAQQAQQQLATSAQKHRCDAARTHYAIFAGGGRIWKADENGQRVYYSDQEIDAERVRAKAAMDSACGA